MVQSRWLSRGISTPVHISALYIGQAPRAIGRTPLGVLVCGYIGVEFLHNLVTSMIIDSVVSFVEDKETNAPS